ncbi:MAG: MFS transporter [Alphaproteobacteria bacterium]
MPLPSIPDEFRTGWRILLACSVAAGTGITLVFLNFSMFILPLSRDLGVSRGELGAVQALIITAAIGSPVVGRLADLFGVRRVYFASTVLMAAVHLFTASQASNIYHMGMATAALGFIGVGTSSVVMTRPINAHFREHRGKALGLMAVGVSLVSMVSPPVLQWVMEIWSWRAGFAAMAVAALLIGIPTVAALLPESGRVGSGIGANRKADAPADRRFLRERDFWLLTLSLIFMSLATAGTISQLAPMIQDEGLDASVAALALTFFAGGQFVGRLGGGWLLDRFEPRRVSFALTLAPAIGFVVLLTTAGLVPAALLAAAIIGLQQGAELDIFSYFIGRRFDVARYGTIYGALVGLGWIGNVGGLLGMGKIYDLYGSYAPGQALGIAALVISATLVLLVRLPEPAKTAQG